MIEDARARVIGRGPMPRATALLTAAGLALRSLSAGAADAPAASVASSSFVNLLQMLVALLVVLAAIGAFAWLMRRFGAGPLRIGGGVLKVVGGVMVGPRERVVVVEVGETWLLLGVAAGHVTLVHSMPRPAAAAERGAEPAAFGQLLAQLTRARPSK